MYSIRQNYKNEIVINKSKFICILYPVDNVNNIKEIIDKLKQEYKDATHYCYAYIIKQNQKYNDDGEPSGTAGAPILNVLKNKELNNILAVVIRYFGGIKLGAGGLVRAYTKAVSECITISELYPEQKYISLELEITYENINKLYQIIKEEYIKEKEFDEDIRLNINIPYNEYNNIKDSLHQICKNIKEKEIINQ